MKTIKRHLIYIDLKSVGVFDKFLKTLKLNNIIKDRSKTQYRYVFYEITEDQKFDIDCEVFELKIGLK